MNTFHTRSSPKKMIQTVLCTGLLMAALAFLGLKVAVVTWLYFEGMVILTVGFCLAIVAKTHWEIRFEDSRILLYNTGNRRSYVVEDIPRSDLMITQTKGQKEKNTCDLQIRGTVFRFYDVESCREMGEYIRRNFPG